MTGIEWEIEKEVYSRANTETEACRKQDGSLCLILIFWSYHEYITVIGTDR